MSMENKDNKYILKEADINNKTSLTSRIRLHLYANRVFQKQLNKMQYPKKFNKLTLFILSVYSGENNYFIPAMLLIGALLLIANIWFNSFLLLEIGVILFVFAFLILLLKILYKNNMKKMSINVNGEMDLNYDGTTIVYTNQGGVHSWLIENIFCVCIFDDGLAIIFNKSNIYFNLLRSQFVEENQYLSFVENIVSEIDDRKIIKY